MSRHQNQVSSTILTTLWAIKISAIPISGYIAIFHFLKIAQGWQLHTL